MLTKFPLTHPLSAPKLSNIIINAWSPAADLRARGAPQEGGRGPLGRSERGAATSPVGGAARSGRGAGAAESLTVLRIAIRNITGQLPSLIKAKMSVANFNLRKGAERGVIVTLRRDSLARFVNNYLFIARPSAGSLVHDAATRPRLASPLPTARSGRPHEAHPASRVAAVDSFSAFSEARAAASHMGRSAPPTGGPRPITRRTHEAHPPRFAGAALASTAERSFPRANAPSRCARAAERRLGGIDINAALRTVPRSGHTRSATGAIGPSGSRAPSALGASTRALAQGRFARVGGGHVLFTLSRRAAAAPMGPRRVGDRTQSAFVLSANLLPA
jgi:hypothetical protein